MSRIIPVSSLAVLLTACAGQSANQVFFEKERLACADVGIVPGSSAFEQCVLELDQSLWDERMDRH
jgi:hypothetical protein